MTIMTIADEGSLTAGASTTIGPTSANGAWVVHNLYVTNSKQLKVEIGDGTYWVHIDTITESMLAFCFHLTYTHKLRITNLEGSTIYYSYDGVSVV
jgi:hypothetical protein